MSQPGVSQIRVEARDLLSAKSPKLLKLWCRERGSNSYGSFDPQDFKSYFTVLGNPHEFSKLAVLQGFAINFWLGLHASEMAFLGRLSAGCQPTITV